MSDQMDAQMAAWMKYAEPGKEHEFLHLLKGTFDAKCSFWMQPGAEPQRTEGMSVNALILGGRFLQSKFEGPSPMGAPFEGLAIDGFDRQKKKYVGIWVDTMGTIMMVFEGDVNASGKVRTMIAEYTDPMTGKPTRMKGVTTVVSADEHRYQAWNQTPDGEFSKVMEIAFTRK